jgi:hypothetical protein
VKLKWNLGTAYEKTQREVLCSYSQIVLGTNQSLNNVYSVEQIGRLEMRKVQNFLRGLEVPLIPAINMGTQDAK